MSSLLKETVKSLFAANDAAYKLLFRAYFWSGKRLPIDRVPAGDGQGGATFTSIYRNNGWGSLESRSGAGSTLASTANIRRELPGLVERLNIRTLLDAPCGDFNWMKEVALPAGCTISAPISFPTSSRMSPPGSARRLGRSSVLISWTLCRMPISGSAATA